MNAKRATSHATTTAIHEHERNLIVVAGADQAKPRAGGALLTLPTESRGASAVVAIIH
jgi:hypothetical protein